MTASLITTVVFFLSLLQYAEGQTCPSNYNVYISPTTPRQLVACGTSTVSGVIPTTCPTGAVCLTVGNNLPQYQQLCCVPVGTDLGAGTVGAGSACPSTAITCSGGSSCTNGICTCPFGTTNNAGFCATISVTSSPTNPVCAVGQVLVNGQCFNQVAAGGTCSVTAQCTGGLQCLNFICAGTFTVAPTAPPIVITQNPFQPAGCDVTQVSVGGFCYNKVPPDQTCTVTQQCQFGSQCDPTLKTCKCVAPQMNMGGTCATPGGRRRRGIKY